MIVRTGEKSRASIGDVMDEETGAGDFEDYGVICTSTNDHATRRATFRITAMAARHEFQRRVIGHDPWIRLSLVLLAITGRWGV